LPHKVEDQTMNIRSNIIAQFRQVAQEQDRRLAPLNDRMELMNSGLDSLCFAIVVSRLETSLGIDPFSTSEDARFPVTLGDFISFYENAAS
jgi:hypothetical protein